MGAVIGLVAIALQSIAEFSLQMPGNAALFAVVAGLAIHDGRRLIRDQDRLDADAVLAARDEPGDIPYEEVRRKAGLA